MKTLDTLLDYSLWPLLFGGAVAGMAYGMSVGHGPLAFNITYLILAASLFILERVRPHEEDWHESDGQEIPDLAHTLLTKFSVQVLVLSAAVLGISTQMGDKPGGGIWPAQWPMFLQIVLGLVVAEFGLYWAHRVAHEWMPLWRFHAVHHSSKKLWFFNTGRFHFIDTFKSTLFTVPCVAISGAPGPVMVWVGGITAFIGILTHCNVRMRFGWLNYLFNTPGLHRWHHSMDLREGNKNYGENLVLWDLIFRTYYDDSRRRPPKRIGIHEAMPKTFFGQLAVPFYWKRFQAEQKRLKLEAKAAKKQKRAKETEPAGV